MQYGNWRPVSYGDGPGLKPSCKHNTHSIEGYQTILAKSFHCTYTAEKRRVSTIRSLGSGRVCSVVFKIFFNGARKMYECLTHCFYLLSHRSTVRVIQSHRAGVGKTLRKNRCTQRIRQMIHAKAGSRSIQAVSNILHFCWWLARFTLVVGFGFFPNFFFVRW